LGSLLLGICRFKYRGIAKSELGDLKGAIEDYTQSIRINPNFAQTYYNRGVAKSDLEDYQGAITDYTNSLRLDPDDFPSYINRSHTKRKIGEYKSYGMA
jgi:tetratricopeptide (TPR) repeat protein